MNKQKYDFYGNHNEQPINVVIEDDPEDEDSHNVTNSPRSDNQDSVDIALNNYKTISLLEQDNDHSFLKNYASQQYEYKADSNIDNKDKNQEYLQIDQFQQYQQSKITKILNEVDLNKENIKVKQQNIDLKKIPNLHLEGIKNLQNEDIENVKWSEAAVEIFNNVFLESFKNAESNFQVDPYSNQIYINKQQFQQATQQVEDIEHLSELFQMADLNKNGKIFQQNLLDVIKQDLINIYEAILPTDEDNLQQIKEIVKGEKGSLIFQAQGIDFEQFDQENQQENYEDKPLKKKKDQSIQNQNLTERAKETDISSDFKIDKKNKIRLNDFDQSAKKLDKIYENADGELQKYKIEYRSNKKKDLGLTQSPEYTNMSKQKQTTFNNQYSDNKNRASDLTKKSFVSSKSKRSQSWKRKSNLISYNYLIEQTMITSHNTIKLVNENSDETFVKYDNQLPDMKLIEEQANSILNEIFYQFFDQNDKIYIKDYEQAINQYFVSTDDIIKLKDIFDQADSNKLNFVSRSKLLHVLKEDLIKYQKYNERTNILSSQVSEEVKTIEKKSSLNDFKINLKQNLSALKDSQIDPKLDPILNLLSKSILQPDNLSNSIQNLSQTIEYIKLYKLEDYYCELEYLKYLFSILYDSSLHVQSQIENLLKIENSPQ